jgi:hypothetical protein
MANNMVKFQESMKKLRENPDTSRAGLKWDDSEDENVLNKLKGGMTFINSMISKNIYNPTIRDNYQLLKEILNRLTVIESKLNE